MTEYLRLLEPILTSQHHERVKGIVKQFTAPTGLGPILQQYLIDKREEEANWVRNLYLTHILTQHLYLGGVLDVRSL